MKVSNHFKIAIEDHLRKFAERDPLFAKTYAKPEKNIDDCITYILNTVQKSGCSEQVVEQQEEYIKKNEHSMICPQLWVSMAELWLETVK